MRRMLLGAAVVAMAVAVPLATTVGASAATHGFDHLRPGTIASYAETVPVQVVFVGFPASIVRDSAVRAQLPASSRPKIMSKLWYDLPGALGLNYTYDYRLSHAPLSYADALFGTLGSMARTQQSVDGSPRTAYQQAYNDQRRNVLDVTTNYYIDAPSVERYLVQHPAPGVDTRRNTIYFINWYGRSDFRFHVYTKFGEPDPDTGYDFGKGRESRKVLAWGGTPSTDEETGFGRDSRTWFYDLSAGPDSWTGSWNVDDSDLDGDGAFDYRIPPSWEYLHPKGYRDPRALGVDLGRVVRYVGLDLLFTSSPIYPPMLTPPDLPRSVNLDENTYENLDGVNASKDLLKLDYLRHEEQEVLPFPLTADSQDLPYDRKAQRCVRTVFLESCYPTLPYGGDANLFVDNAVKTHLWRDGGGDYEAGAFNYAVAAERNAPFLGFADDNYRDGTQSGIFNFASPGIIADGYGLTTTNIHEYGHHFGLSHPHDGYDPASGVAFNPTGRYYFAWVGDESNSMMSYIDLNWDFSQFDKDNMARFYTAGYTTVAQDVAQRILNSSRPAAGLDDLTRADALVGRAKAALAGHDYQGAVRAAKAAYEAVQNGAADAGVTLRESDPWRLDRGSDQSKIPGYANDADDRAEAAKRNAR